MDKNGEWHLIETTGNLWQIIVANGLVYLGGHNHGEACYWVCDGEQVDMYLLGSNSEARSIFVQGEQVYAGGFYYNDDDSDYFEAACYWDGEGIRHNLKSEGSESKVISLIVHDDDQVYAAGYTDGKACYWDNAGRHDLDHGDSDWSCAKCILVW